MKPYSAFQPKLIAFIILLLLPSISFCQDEEKIRSLFVEAESYFLFEEYKDALPLYQRILAVNPDNYNISYKIGICYLNDNYQKSKSISYLEKAVKGTSAQSKPTSFKETKAPLEALYYLGNAYRVNNRLKDAIEAYEQFKLVLDPVVYDVALVDEQISACKIAAEQERNPMYFISNNLGNKINDRFEESNPVVSGDETVIAFTRKLQFYDAVFVSRKVNGEWTDPVNLTQDFAVDGNTYTTGLSYDGDDIYVYRSDNFDGNLYTSHYKNGKWSKLEKLNGNINTKYWESAASVSKDGKTLYFTSNREGGYGGLDIYKSQKGRNGEWGPAVNLGPVINSKYNEDTPFVTDDGSTLYFSSMGHYNMGGYDIFYSTRLDNGQWSKPVNAGYPLNTTADDLFFFPVHDGAFAYYSKYDPANSIGMADIYKLEVFTELHPRKFILNGVARVDGKVNPTYTRYTASLIDSRTGRIIDQKKLNPDGTYKLDALAGDFKLEINGDGIADKAENLTIPLNSPSNIIAHSSLLTPSSESTASAITAQPAVETVVYQGPEMNIPVVSYNVTTNEPIPIRINLDRNTKLKVATIVDGRLVASKTIPIRRNQYVYMLTPEPGVNTVHFVLTNSKGDSTVRDVTVIYTPGEITAAPVTAEKQPSLSDSDRYSGMSSLTEGKLQEYLKTLDLTNFKSIADLYDFLIAHAGEIGYSIQDVDNLMIKFLAQKNLNFFYDEMKKQASDSLSKSVENTNLKDKGIYTADSFVDHLYSKADKADSVNYTLNDIRDALYKIAALDRNPHELLNLFESYAEGELSAKLKTMNGNWKNYSNTLQIADEIWSGTLNNEFPVEQLKSMLKMAAEDINMNFLQQGLIFISSDNLKNTLLDLNLESAGIRNSQEFITHMLNNAEKDKYSKRELLDNIEKVRNDPYYFVDLFRKMLVEKATGSLKEFIQEIDVRGLQINTFEQLVDYLLNQSQFHDYNREMVYQLMIDLINPKNVAEFINLLKKYADSHILEAINATDPSQFSKPVEVMQYLLSVADQYNYTERDLLRVLLKMILSKGPSAGATDEKQGWLARIDRPALITSLIIVNGIVILLLIIFLLRRKKRKNE
jgi:tetratricopeptide (TPR) repeat protein